MFTGVSATLSRMVAKIRGTCSLVDWLQAFNDEHYRPEPKRRNRPASFLPPAQREG